MDPYREIKPFFDGFRYPELVGRPARSEVISKDDILNLVIALELAKDVLDFLEDHHIFME